MRSTWPLATWVDTMKPSESNFTESGTPRSPATRCGSPAPVLLLASALSGSMRQISLAPITGKYSKPVGADFHRVGRRHVLQQHPRRAAVQIDFQQAPALAALADEQPPAWNGDAVCGRDVVAQHPGAAGGVQHADPAVHHLGGVEVAAGIEGHVVGRDDVATLGAHGVQLPG